MTKIFCFWRLFLFYSCLMWSIVWIQSDSCEDVNGENIWSNVSKWVRFSLEWAQFNADWLMLNAVGVMSVLFETGKSWKRPYTAMDNMCALVLYECKRSNAERVENEWNERMKGRWAGELTENHKQFTVWNWNMKTHWHFSNTQADTQSIDCGPQASISRQCLPFKCSCV